LRNDEYYHELERCHNQNCYLFVIFCYTFVEKLFLHFRGLLTGSRGNFPVGKIAEKAVFRSVFLTILSAELTKNALLQTVFLGDFAHWVMRQKMQHANLNR